MVGHRIGDDRLDGGPGNDTLYGFGSGHHAEQELRGEAGSDVIYGGPQLDYLLGGEGSDRLYGRGDSDFDFVYGEGGNDLLVPGPGMDAEIYGGPGIDKCVVQPEDQLVSECEK